MLVEIKNLPETQYLMGILEFFQDNYKSKVGVKTIFKLMELEIASKEEGRKKIEAISDFYESACDFVNSQKITEI